MSDQVAAAGTRELLEAGDHRAAPHSGPDAARRAELANALAGLKRRFYGRGPDRAKVYIDDEYVFAVLEGGLTAAEQTLLEADAHALVRQYRLAFQEAVRSTITQVVEDVLEHEVRDYHSQIVFDPPRTFEIFVLGEPKPGGAS